MLFQKKKITAINYFNTYNVAHVGRSLVKKTMLMKLISSQGDHMMVNAHVFYDIFLKAFSMIFEHVFFLYIISNEMI